MAKNCKSTTRGKPRGMKVTKTFYKRCKHRGIKPTGGNKH